MTTVPTTRPLTRAYFPPALQLAGWLSLGLAALWAALLARWMTFASFDWDPLASELALAEWPPLAPYLIYGGLLALALAAGLLILRGAPLGARLGQVEALVGIVGAIAWFFISDDFYGSVLLLALAGMLMLLLRDDVAWSLNYPAAFWLMIFFVLPMLIVLAVSLGERTRLGTVAYPPLTLDLRVYLDDYGRFFQRINGDYIYLRIFGRSFLMALGNTIICLLIGYPFAYWIARQPRSRRNLLIFLVMIPFWTNFLVRTYAWMLILRDTGLINNLWTITIHDFAAARAGAGGFFAWLAEQSSTRLPLLFNQRAVFLGLFYGYLPFVVLPIYSNLERLDWSLLEAAADLGANGWYRTTRILLPLTMPGTVAAGIIVFIPSLGAYVTPDLLGGGKVALLGNLLQQQFMQVRDWPFGSAIGFLMMALMLMAILIYFRVGGRAAQ